MPLWQRPRVAAELRGAGAHPAAPVPGGSFEPACHAGLARTADRGGLDVLLLPDSLRRAGDAARRPWSEDEPEGVADRLEVLRRATAADELLITTIAHDQRDRLRSFELLARAWG